jgi:DNA-binding XRE family transcriptional regulator
MGVLTPEQRTALAAKAAAKRAAAVLANPDAHPLAKARARRGLTQQDLEALSGVGGQVVTAIENGRRNPSRTTRARLSLALAIDPKELFPG